MPNTFDAIPAADPLLDEEGERVEPTDLQTLNDLKNDIRIMFDWWIPNLKRDVLDADSEETKAEAQKLLDWMRTCWETLP